MSILHKTPKGILLKCNSDSCPMPSSHTHGRSRSSRLAVPSAFTFSSACSASLHNFHGNSASAGTHSEAHSLTPPPTSKRDTDRPCPALFILPVSSLLSFPVLISHSVGHHYNHITSTQVTFLLFFSFSYLPGEPPNLLTSSSLKTQNFKCRESILIRVLLNSLSDWNS